MNPPTVNPVQSFRAKDGSLHDTADQQLNHDDAKFIKQELDEMVRTALATAPFKDDWRTRAISEDWEMENALVAVVTKDTAALKLVLAAQERIHARQQAAATSKVTGGVKTYHVKPNLTS